MRPQQQNRRMRGRNNNNNSNNNNNNNRKGPNPLTRNYESNGPDVKIRGSAQQIAEKYTTLARDATSSGDRVMAENYLQHAEHYNRIIAAAAQAQMPIQNFQQNRDDFDDEDGEERDEAEVQGNGDGNQPDSNGSGPQPVIDGVPAEVALNSDNGNGGNGNGGRENFRNRDRRDGNRNNNGQRNGDYQRRDNQRRDEQPQVQAAAEDDVQDSLPAFITETVPTPAPVEEVAEPARKSRKPRRGERRDEAAAEAPQPAMAEAQAGEEVFAGSDD